MQKCEECEERRKNNKIVGIILCITIVLIAIFFGYSVLRNMKDVMADRQELCNQWCCGCAEGNADGITNKDFNFTCYCTDTLYDQDSDECVIGLNAGWLAQPIRENRSNNTCPYKITQVLNEVTK